MKVMLDLNVLLDVVQRREPFVRDRLTQFRRLFSTLPSPYSASRFAASSAATL
jgi:hypothetical protein